MDAVVLAAGEGTRLRPLTVTRPKPMLPVAGRPILEWGLRALSELGFKRVVMVVGYRKERILQHFGESFEGMSIAHVVQPEQLGTAHALLAAEDYVSGSFLVLNGDLLISEDFLRGFLQLVEQDSAQASVAVVRVEDPQDFGVVELEGERVKRIVEKPKVATTNLVNAGVYVFNEEVFDFLRRVEKSERFEYELTDAIKLMVEKSEVAGHLLEQGLWLDVGRPWDLLDANELLMKRLASSNELRVHPEAEVEEHATIKGEVGIGKGTVVKSGAYIEGPCLIGKDCVIGPNCYIRAYSSIGDNVRIGNAVEVKNSIVMKGTNICHLAYVGDSIIGENCNLGAGTKIANLRADELDVKVQIRRMLVSSGKRKLGCIMGDHVKTGVNVSIMPGRLIYPYAYVEAGSVVRNTIYGDLYELEGA